MEEDPEQTSNTPGEQMAVNAGKMPQNLTRLEIPIRGETVVFLIDLSAPSQRFIYDWCQDGLLYEFPTVLALNQTLDPGDTFLDVGAHVGFFTCLAARMVGPGGRVVAFEPNPANHAFLKRNIEANGLINVTVIQSAVGERDGLVTLYENLDNDGGHALWQPGLHPTNPRSRARSVASEIPQITIDSISAQLDLGNIKAIKIDTEGAEFRVVQGAAGRLAQGTVSLVICEHHQFALEALSANVSDLLRFFYTKGFEGYISSDGIEFREIPVDANFKPSPRWTEEHRERAENIFFVKPGLFIWPEVLRPISSGEQPMARNSDSPLESPRKAQTDYNPEPPRTGINLATPVCQTGYGVVGLNLLASLKRAGHRIALFPIGRPSIPPESEPLLRSALEMQERLTANAPTVYLKEITLPVTRIGRGIQALFPIFELDRFTTAEKETLAAVDRVIVCSRWAERVAWEQGIDPSSIRVVPLGVDTSIFSPTASSTQLLEGDTLFGCIGKFELRKGQDLLIEAFNLAFEPADRVQLLLHGCNTMLGESFNAFWRAHCAETRLGDRITVVPKPFSTHREVAQIMSKMDCGVFPARAEGWNLELLEMMALGKPVIATNYSGHTEFANEQNCFLIQTQELEDAQDGVKFKGQGRWARFGPDQLEQLVCLLRSVHQRRQSGQLEPNYAGITTAREFSWENSADLLTAALA